MRAAASAFISRSNWTMMAPSFQRAKMYTGERHELGSHRTTLSPSLTPLVASSSASLEAVPSNSKLSRVLHSAPSRLPSAMAAGYLDALSGTIS